MTMVIRELDATSTDEINLVATRMHKTLAEVLDEQRADAMFSHDGLVERVRWHLDDGDDRQAAVFLCETSDGTIVGHTMVRAEDEDGTMIGLFATTYVDPAHRQSGAASALIERGERWMRQRRLPEAATYTDVDNVKLLNLYRKHDYAVAVLDEEWARASKPLA